MSSSVLEDASMADTPREWCSIPRDLVCYLLLCITSHSSVQGV